MLKTKNQAKYQYHNLMSPTVNLIFSAVLVVTLVGCGTNGDGSPLTSSLSAPTDATEDSSPDANPSSSETQPVESKEVLSLLSEDAMAGLIPDPDEADFTPPPSETDVLPIPSDEDPVIAMTPTETGVTARLTWSPSPDNDVAGYYVYYGKQPSGEPGSCHPYEESIAVEAPPATIPGLEPNTPYFFAISAFNESQSPCSTELMLVTPPVKS